MKVLEGGGRRLTGMADVSRNATFAQAMNCLNAGDVANAERLCHQMLAAGKKEHRATALLGHIATITSRYDEAVALLTECVTQAPREVNYHVLLGEALTTGGRFQEAVTRFDQALRLRTGYLAAVAGKANALTRMREWTKARELLEPHVKAGREDAGVAIAYVNVATHDQDYQLAIEAGVRHTGPDTPGEQRRQIWFLLGKAHEQAGNFDDAFDAYSQGNPLAAAAWDPAGSSRWHDRVVDSMSRERLDGVPRASDPAALPVFVVGMPRSGSTLIEQIIDAHPQAHGAGEICDLTRMIGGLGTRIGSTLEFPDCISDLEQQDVDDLAADYLERLRGYAPDAERICNKELSLYKHLGLMAAVFPEGHIIHSRRNPLDTCLSCFAQGFQPGAQKFSTDLRAMGMAYNDYLTLMDHWRQIDVPMLEVDYEQLVADQETMSRRIIEFCGLPWDDRCLRFYETKRAVRTLSQDQVSRPIYRSSVQRHRNFEPHLGPLRDVLEQGLRA